MGEFFVYSFFFGALLTFFPVFVYIDFYLDAASNRGWFSLSAYHRLRLMKGYAQLKQYGILFHLTKKRRIYCRFPKWRVRGKNLKSRKGFSRGAFIRYWNLAERTMCACVWLRQRYASHLGCCTASSRQHIRQYHCGTM